MLGRRDRSGGARSLDTAFESPIRLLLLWCFVLAVIGLSASLLLCAGLSGVVRLDPCFRLSGFVAHVARSVTRLLGL